MDKVNIDKNKYEIVKGLVKQNISLEQISGLVGLSNDELSVYLEEIKYDLTDEKVQSMHEAIGDDLVRSTPYDSYNPDTTQNKHK